MIKKIDKIGSSIVLSCYFLLIPVSFLSLFAITPFILGVIINAWGLSQRTEQKWVIIYVSLAAGLLFSIFPLLQSFGFGISVIVYTIPGLVGSSSLVMAHLAKNNSSSPIKFGY